MSHIKDVKKTFQTGELPFELGGRKRRLQFDLNSFAELENKFGSVNDAMNELQTGGMKSIRFILWTALIHDEAILDDIGEPVGYKITPYQVGGWITPQMLPEISQKLTEAMGVSLPDVKDLPEAKAMLDRLGIDTTPLGESGLPVAQVVPTEEEKAAMEADSKNG